MHADHRSAAAETEVRVALLDGDVVGFVLLVGEDDGVLLENVAVLPAHHGRGIGRQLLMLAEHRTVELGESPRWSSSRVRDDPGVSRPEFLQRVAEPGTCVRK